jgi:hypothetical protein
MKWYRALRISEQVQTLRESTSMLRYTYIVYPVNVKFCLVRESETFRIDREK